MQDGLFTIESRDRHDSPNYTFTWKLTEKGVKKLESRGTNKPFIYVIVTREIPGSPQSNHDEDCGCFRCCSHKELIANEVYCLHEGAGQIQFQKSGTFQIHILLLSVPRDNWNDARIKINNYYNEITCQYVDKSPMWEMPDFVISHIEADPIKISDNFFAQPPNKTLWWWANLWWEDPPKNTCYYKRRLLFFLWMQIPAVSIWAFIRFLCGFVYVTWLSLLAFRWKYIKVAALIHPFTYSLSDIKEHNIANNYAESDSNGRNRTFIKAAFRVPLVDIILFVAIFQISKLAYKDTYATLLIAGTIIVTIALFFLIKAIIDKIAKNYKEKNKPETLESWAQIYYSKVPREDMPKKTTLKVRYLDLKGKLCLPFEK